MSAPEFADDVWQRCAAMVAAHLEGDGDGLGLLMADMVDQAADDDEVVDLVREHIEALVAQQAMLVKSLNGTASSYRRMIAGFAAGQ